MIPFAFNSARDHWCWSTTSLTAPSEYEVWFCPQDEKLGKRFAPSFPAWFYRNCLSYASGGFDNDPPGIKDARSKLLVWSQRLAEIHSGDWAKHLQQLAESEPISYKHPKLRASVSLFGFITSMEVDKIVKDQFGKRYVDDNVEWGRFPEDE